MTNVDLVILSILYCGVTVLTVPAGASMAISRGYTSDEARAIGILCGLLWPLFYVGGILWGVSKGIWDDLQLVAAWRGLKSLFKRMRAKKNEK